MESEKKKSSAGKVIYIILTATLLLANAYYSLTQNSEKLIESFSLNETECSIAPDVSRQLSVQVSYKLPFLSGNEKIIWETDNPDVADVDDSGLVTAHSKGCAQVKASAADGKYTASCSFTVDYYGQIGCDSESISLGIGESAKTTWSGTESLSFESSDESIVSVSGDGTLTGNGVGNAEIIARSDGWLDGKCAVKVCAAPEKLILSHSRFSMGVGEVYKIGVKTEADASASSFTYASSDDSVISIGADGTVTAQGEGKAKLTVTAYNGASAEADVSVSKAPTKLTLEKNSAKLYSGQTVKILPKTNTGSIAYKFTSSNEKAATVDGEGVVTALGRGTSRITVETYNGLTAQFTVTVKIVNFTEKYTYKKLFDDVNYLSQSFPELIKTEIIGQSVQGKDIQLMKFGTGERIALITAGFHSNESAAVNFTMRCVEEYAAAYYSDKGLYGNYNMKKLLSTYTLYIVPLVNPDGMEIVNLELMPPWSPDKDPEEETPGVFWRDEYTANANGVNLNRNFPFRWDQTITSTEGPHINLYRGPSEASEPETQMLIKLCSEHKFEWLFTMHVRGYFIYWRDEYTHSVPGDYELATRLRDRCGFKLLGPSKLKNLGGGFENWFRAEYKRPGFCIELISPQYTKFVNENFERNLCWQKTKYVFIQGMVDK